MAMLVIQIFDNFYRFKLKANFKQI